MIDLLLAAYYGVDVVRPDMIRARSQASFANDGTIALIARW
jgi:hypothetical protein